VIPALQAVVLGIIQGLTEFLPVSSSGHLVLAPRLFGWNDLGLSFDVALHLGTLLALLLFFRAEWIAIIKGFFTSFTVRPKSWSRDQRLAWMLVLASIPAGILGVLIGEDHFRTPAWVALFLLGGSLIMVAAELLGSRSRGFDELRAWDAGTVGVAQAVALFPGISRSGVTISTGMLDGLDREAAARFAFLMSAPVIAGAGLWQAQKVIRGGGLSGQVGVMAAGFAASAAAGFFAIKYFLAFLRKHTLYPFVIYRVAVASAVFIVLAVKH
jgi:undecaprenyl-diphosphatase